MEIKQKQIDKLISILNHSITDLKVKVKVISWIQGYQAAIITAVSAGLLIKSITG